MILSESPLSQRAAQESLPLRDAFAVLFFVSVGMLFDPASVMREPWPLLATLFIIVVGKSAAAFVIVLAFRRPVATALTISASLAQIGEFSFILAELGVKLNLLPAQARDLILAGAILSILVNPLIFAIVDRLHLRIETRRGLANAGAPAGPSSQPEAGASGTAPEPGDATALTDHTVLVGYGRVEEFRNYYNEHRVHQSLNGSTPGERSGEPPPAHAVLAHHAWRHHCRGLFQMPIAA